MGSVDQFLRQIAVIDFHDGRLDFADQGFQFVEVVTFGH